MNRPSLQSLIARVTQQIGIRLQGVPTPVTVAVTSVVGTVLAQELNLEYGYADNFPAQFFIALATGGYLDDRGGEYGVLRQQAIAAAGTVLVAGIARSALPAGAIARTLDGTVSVATIAAVTIPSGGSIVAAVTALTGGVAGNLAAGAVLTLVSAVAGINAQLIAQPAATGSLLGLTGGVDQESDDAYRLRILARTQNTPQGGNAQDFVNDVKAVPGVTRAWAYPKLYGAGTVAMAPVYDARAPGSILPTSGDIATVLAALGAVTTTVATTYVFALALDPIAVTLTNVVPQIGTTLAQAEANIRVSLAALFAGATPGGAAAGDGVQQTASGPISGLLALEAIYAAIAATAGVASFDLTAPSADIASATGHLAVLGTVTLP